MWEHSAQFVSGSLAALVGLILRCDGVVRSGVPVIGVFVPRAVRIFMLINVTKEVKS